MIKRTKFNIAFLGGRKSGKTSIINAYLKNEFSFETLSTFGIDSSLKKHKFDNKEYKFKIFDISGEERFRSISNTTIRLADGIDLVFAIDNHNSYREIVDRIIYIEENVCLEKKVLFIIGNKIDVSGREVRKKQVEEFAKRINIKYFETSAYSRQGINETFEEIFKEVYDKNILYNNNKPIYQNNNNINYSSFCTNEIIKLNSIYNASFKLYPLNKYNRY